MREEYSTGTQYNAENAIIGQSTVMSEIAIDTLQGLSANPKYLLPKYFYDNAGSGIFQEIMKMPEYYLTNCELEIFESHKKRFAEAFMEGVQTFNLIELGPGDGMKTKILLRFLVDTDVNFKFVPIDISKKANDELTESLKREIPSLKIEPETGDYFQLIKTIKHNPVTRQIVLFLGSNIGNLNDQDISLFLNSLSEFTQTGDKVLIGFDLKKSPDVIMKAYNDPHGLTRKFNLNHLARLNRELQADFDLSRFEHHTEYNPLTGKVKSFLISTVEQSVYIGALGQSYTFKQWEPIFMELSRKFDLKNIEALALNHGFKVDHHFTDHRSYFVDSLWTKI